MVPVVELTAERNNADELAKLASVGVTEFKEHEEVMGILSSLPGVCGNQVAEETTYERFLYIMDFYQEQPHLLDHHLEQMIGVLLGHVRDPKNPPAVVHIACKFLYLITKTRGHKVIVRLMPHEVADVEPVLAMINQQNKADSATWETRYMLLLWLSIVCMIPFDMSRLDSNLRTETGEAKKPVMDRIIDTGKLYLDVSDKSRDAAAYMLSRFMTRPDVKRDKLPEYLDWSLAYINKADKESMVGVIATSGVLTTLALLFKHGKREDLVHCAPQVLEIVVKLGLLESYNTVLRKLGIKLLQRLGLTFLKARVAAWRYQRGSRSLADNLTSDGSRATSMSGTALVGDEAEEEYDVPEEMEDVIERLLTGLRDPNTIVRWSAAKGIGRITGRLPRELADEVVGSLMELFTLAETDVAWHGGCLALAELGRRGLLLPNRLPEVVPVIIRALTYDEKKGNFSIGSHVRDAACYVCWAFARAYEPEDLKPYVHQIASFLVIVTIFDREVNVRRAAAAAFQENVGRQGQFPHGIDILTECDYFAVGNRNNCYLELSMFVTQFEEYTLNLIEHLVKIKINHWDIEVRELSAQALHRLTTRAPEFVASDVLPGVLDRCTTIDLNERHGAILAAVEMTHSLAKISAAEKRNIRDVVGDASLQKLREITPKLKEGGLFKGLGGELMRKAACCLIEELSLAKAPFHNDPIIGLWQELLDDCLQHLEPEVQNAAVAAIPSFFTQYYSRPDGSAVAEMQDQIVSKYLGALDTNVETTRIGYTLALGALPKFFLQGKLDQVLERLIAACKIREKETKWAQARGDAVKSITRLCETVGVVKDGSQHACICAENLQSVFDAYFLTLKDYTLDSRGDVGTYVREASMSGLKTVSVLTVLSDSSLLTPEMVRCLFCNLVQQASEKIDRTRAHAGQIFAHLLYHEPEIPHIPHKDDLMRIFPREEVLEMNWAVPATTFPKFVDLLALPTYTYNVLLGLTVSVGGLTESLVRYSSLSLLSYLRKLDSDSDDMKSFAHRLLEVFRDNLKQDRVTVPMFKVLDQLLANGCFSYYVENPQDTWPAELLALVKAEIRKVGDPQKLLASVDVLCGLLQFSGDVRKSVLVSLMLLLGHKFPIVRKATGYKLYEALITYDGIVEDEKLEQVMGVLSETQWDKSLAEAKTIRNELCDLIDVPKPVPVKVAAAQKKDEEK